MNQEIPRPHLGGITAWDVHFGNASAKRKQLEVYTQQQYSNPDPPPMTMSIWELVRDVIRDPTMTQLQLLTKYCFTRKKPLRLITKLIPEVLGNL